MESHRTEFEEAIKFNQDFATDAIFVFYTILEETVRKSKTNDAALNCFRFRFFFFGGGGRKGHKRAISSNKEKIILTVKLYENFISKLKKMKRHTNLIISI